MGKGIGNGIYGLSVHVIPCTAKASSYASKQYGYATGQWVHWVHTTTSLVEWDTDGCGSSHDDLWPQVHCVSTHSIPLALLHTILKPQICTFSQHVLLSYLETGKKQDTSWKHGTQGSYVNNRAAKTALEVHRYKYRSQNKTPSVDIAAMTICQCTIFHGYVFHSNASQNRKNYI